jgi:hypothetical protein
MTELETLAAVDEKVALARVAISRGQDALTLLREARVLIARRIKAAYPPIKTADVQAAVMWNETTGETEVMPLAEASENEFWRQIATITARVPLPTIPTIPANVEPEE